MSNDRWQDAFFSRRPGATAEPDQPETEAARPSEEWEELGAVDATAYRAFVVQRGGSRPSMFLHVRSFDARAGIQQGTMLSYPQLYAVDYVDDHTILLDFGMRHVRIEGEHLGELIARLQTASVSVIQAWSAKIWGDKEPLPGTPIVRRITHLGLGQGN